MRKLAASARASTEQPEKNPVSTKAVAASQAKRREEIQAKKRSEEAAKAEEEERIRKQNMLKGRVQAELKSKFGKSAAAQIKEKTNQNIDDMR